MGNDLVATTCDIIQNFKDSLAICMQEGQQEVSALFAQVAEHIAKAEDLETRAANAVGRGALRFGKSALRKGKYAALHPVAATQELGQYVAQTGLALGRLLVISMEAMGQAERCDHVPSPQEAQQIHQDAVAFNHTVDQLLTRIRETSWEDGLEHLTEFTFESFALCGLGKLSVEAASRLGAALKELDQAMRIERELGIANQVVAPANAYIEAVGIGIKTTAEFGPAKAAEIIEVVKANPALVEAEGLSGAVRKLNAANQRGKAFEEFLVKKLGGRGSFKVGGREFDGAVGNIWYEAKSGKAWEKILSSKEEFERFTSSMGQRLRIARDHGATYELFSEVSIPQNIREWLINKNIKFTELK
jgi:hypothetical protein